MFRIACLLLSVWAVVEGEVMDSECTEKRTLGQDLAVNEGTAEDALSACVITEISAHTAIRGIGIHNIFQPQVVSFDKPTVLNPETSVISTPSPSPSMTLLPTPQTVPSPYIDADDSAPLPEANLQPSHESTLPPLPKSTYSPHAESTLPPFPEFSSSPSSDSSLPLFFRTLPQPKPVTPPHKCSLPSSLESNSPPPSSDPVSSPLHSTPQTKPFTPESSLSPSLKVLKELKPVTASPESSLTLITQRKPETPHSLYSKHLMQQEPFTSSSKSTLPRYYKPMLQPQPATRFSDPSSRQSILSDARDVLSLIREMDKIKSNGNKVVSEDAPSVPTQMQKRKHRRRHGRRCK